MNDPTRFELDARARAMLEEMGVRVWWPMPEAQTGTAKDAEAPAQEARPSSVEAAPVPQGVATAAVRGKPPEPMTPVAPAVAAVVAPGPLPQVQELDWAALEQAVQQCQACGLCNSRKNTVFGVGDVQAQWMVIGEAPGENEDLQGQPFVGQAGKLLDNMLRAIGLDRQATGQAGVYIANALKCRPPGNRNPEPQEMATCAPYLVRQVQLVKPRIILAMGRFAVQSLLQTTEPIGKLRGRVHQYQGVPVVVTYHPAYLLRNPADKAKAWADLCLALQTLQDTPAV
ncbi:MAG: hypothetical protein RL697_1168 [Pseudomonadota bacterium]|jgi:DNA polymerase